MKLGIKVMLTFCAITVLNVVISLAGYWWLSGINLAMALIAGSALVLAMGYFLHCSISVSISDLAAECSRVTKAAQEGKLDIRGDAKKVKSDFQEVIHGFNKTLDAVSGPLNLATDYLEHIAKGETALPKITESYNGDYNRIKDSLNACIQEIATLVGEVGVGINAAREGKLGIRANPDKTTGVYRKILRGINDTLDAVIGPLNVAAEYIDRISKGDIPPKITDIYNGDFNEIKDNLNACIDAVNGLLHEADSLINAVGDGRLDARGNAAAYTGDWGKLLGGMNGLIEAVANPVNEMLTVFGKMAVNDFSQKMVKDYTGAWNNLKEAANLVHALLARIQEILDNISKGDLSDLHELKKVGKRSANDELIPAIVGMMEAIQNLVDDANMLAVAAVEGRLDTRADVTKHNGDFRKVVEGVNKTLDAVIGPLNVAAEYVDLISKGNIPPKITDTYQGDFNEVKNNLNGCIDVVNGLLKEVEHLIQAVQDGKLDTRGQAAAFAGDWGELVGGMNGMMEAVCNPVNELIAVLKRMAVNDLTKRMDQEYSGAWDDLKKATNDVNARMTRIRETVINISNGSLIDLEVYKKIGRRSENDGLVPGFIKMIEAIQKLAGDANMLAGAAVEGKLDTRADAVRHDGEYRKIIDGVNRMMDAVINPIHEAAGCLKEMADGNLDVRVAGNYKGDHAIIKNALNTTLEALNKIIKEEAVRCLQEIAEGNLDVAITGDYKGDYACIKDALNKTVNDLNESLGQISIAIEQVNTGAWQVSESSQALSQGAAESAGALEELTSSMQEMNSQTKQNAENAMQANQLATQARGTAEKGNEQMAQMVKAMSDINESAANISKIIKAIDEIAFQTNILALNAAVEAARAGKHGKGFTVVAEEVRNLAQRSAKAAKETAEMIEGSIKKTEVGARIAEETSRALEEIVLGTTKVTDLISEIASASKEQALGIGQINEGLNQVDQVTQQNSAGSEELAAASEEMSSQAAIVKQMLDKFKLKKQASPGVPAGRAPQMPYAAHSRPSQKQTWSSKNKPVRTGALEVAATKDDGVKPQHIIPLDDAEFGNF
ncbi:Methyl-accepting chemotaxis protein II [Pelotomaculum schinkii]|uniref:Methyl-accepting chemotaxis protein II n=1 Tax=Pelotomaculum schinkii TaxID=78350 RepID=A0A4Y7R7I4_9FIRM|nr:methyl-accepting chemotaxis protein [Pelotomaculum schinkii]TEB04924.1 Methyl-accepting chemotaxis protein II [Pelotomaculum schinkii]